MPRILKFNNLIYGLGAYQVFRPLYEFSLSYFNEFNRESTNNETNEQRISREYGWPTENGGKPWALISGSSDGMGKLYALFFARAGFNLALSSFNEQQLLDVKKEITEKHPGTEVHPYVVDYSKTIDYSEQINYKDMEQNLRFVVNNVGVLKKISILEDDPRFLQTSIKVNLHPLFLYTKIAINSFKKQNKGLSIDQKVKQKFGILQVVSLSAPRWYVFGGMYGSNKRMCRNFSQLIESQNKSSLSRSNIDQLVLNPGPVTTGMIGHYTHPLKTTTAEQTVHAALKDFGFLYTSNGSQLHSVHGLQVSYTPEWIRNVQRQQMGAAKPVGSYVPWTVL